MIRKSLISICFYVFFSPLVNAIPVEFNLRSSLIESIDEQVNITLVNNGIVATLTANSGVLNATSTGFGVNATGSGDATSLIDDGSGIAELIQIQFNLAVKFLGLEVSSFGTTDAGLLSLNSTPVFELQNSGRNNTGEIFINNGDLLTLAFASGNGFSFDSFSVEMISVNEPASALLLFLTGIMLLINLRNRSRRFNIGVNQNNFI